MRYRLAWLLGGLAAGLVLYRKLRSLTAPAALPPPDSHAEELRRKLDESRSIVSEREELESPETPVDRAERSTGELEERRRQIRERAQAALEELRGEPSSE